MFADGNCAVGTIAASDRFLVASRRTVFTRIRFVHLSIEIGHATWTRTISWPRSINVCRRVGRFATFLKLADGRGYVLTNTRKTGAPLVRFHNLRLDSVDENSGRSMLRWKYSVNEDAAPIFIQPTLAAAIAAYSTSLRLLDQVKRRLSGADAASSSAADAQQRFFRPLNPGSKFTICSKFETRVRTGGKGIASQHFTLGKLSGNSSGWVVLSPEARLTEVGVYIAEAKGAKDPALLSHAVTDDAQGGYIAEAKGAKVPALLSHAVTDDALGAASEASTPNPLWSKKVPTVFVPAVVVGSEAAETQPLGSEQRRMERIAARMLRDSEDDLSSVERLGRDGKIGSNALAHRGWRRLSASRRASSALAMGPSDQASAETEMVALGVDHAEVDAISLGDEVVRTGSIWDTDTPATTPRNVDLAVEESSSDSY